MENHTRIVKDNMVLTSKKQSTTVNTELLKPYNYLVSIPGKNVRKLLTHVLNYWMKIPEDKMEKISNIVGVLHNFSLLIDDIQDRSILRRGIPAAHTIFGIVNTSLSANYVDLLNIEDVMELGNWKAVTTYIEMSRAIWEGQGMELYWRDNFVCPTEEEYLQMIARKTGGLFLLAKNLMEPFSTTNKQLDNFLTAYGLYFQIVDDYQNLNSQVYFEKKGFAEDLSEGKFSFPVVHAINSNEDAGKIIMDILSKRTQDVERKKYCISVIENCGSFIYTKNKIESLKAVVLEELEKLGGNPYFEQFFNLIGVCQ